MTTLGNSPVIGQVLLRLSLTASSVNIVLDLTFIESACLCAGHFLLLTAPLRTEGYGAAVILVQRSLLSSYRNKNY